MQCKGFVKTLDYGVEAQTSVDFVKFLFIMGDKTVQFKKWVAPLLAVSLSVLDSSAVALPKGVTADDGQYTVTLAFTGNLASASAPQLVPLKAVAYHHHSKPNNLTVFKITDPNSIYKELIVVNSDPFTTTGVRHYTDRVTLKNSPVALTLKGEIDMKTGDNKGSWAATDGSKGTYVVHFIDNA